MADRQSYARTTAVAVGSLLLFGVVSYLVVVFGAIAVLPLLLAPTPLADAAGLLAHLLAIGVAVKISLEAARVWLHGWSELLRGTRSQRRVRHAILLLPALLAGSLAVLVVVGGITDASARETPVLLVVVGAVGAAVTWVLARSVAAYREGRRDASGER